MVCVGTTEGAKEEGIDCCKEGEENGETVGEGEEEEETEVEEEKVALGSG